MSNSNAQVVVVTGGSAGLGLEIVRAFARHGAQVFVLARNLERNEIVAKALKESGLNATPLSVDVTSDHSVAAAVKQIIGEVGRIDVWVNNVGKSTRADVMKTTVAEYQKFLEINFLTSVRCWLACKDYLVESSGTLVNIGSLASKTAWPLMAPYSTSKHALAAFTHQLRLEGPKNVNYLHVCPGPIEREENDNRYEEESKGLGEQAKRSGAGAPVKRIDPATLAQKIVRACEQRKRELVIPWHASILFSISQLSATIGDALVRRFFKR